MRTLLLALLPILPLAAPLHAAAPPPDADGLTPESWSSPRAAEYLAFATAVQSNAVLNAIAHMERDAADPGYTAPSGVIDVANWAANFQKLETLQDTRDFDGLYLLNALLGYNGHPYVTPAAWARTEEVLKNFKYWITDPTPSQPDPADPNRFWDESIYFTENHQALYHTIEYLMGQEYPADCFTIVGFTPTGDCSGEFEMTGEEHRLRARDFLLRWFDERWEIGFAEWHSRIYYQKDATPLLTLVEYADDPEIVTRAEMILDVLLLDMATHTQKGVMGVTAGRSEMKDTYSGPVNDTWGITHLLFAQQDEVGYASTSDAGATLFARAKRYRVPQVILEAAHHPGPFVDRMRMSVAIDPEADEAVPPPGHPFGLDEPSFTFWFGLGAYSLWQVVPTTFWGIEEYELSETSFFEPFKDLVEVAGDPPNIPFAQSVAKAVARVISLGLLDEVNSYTWRAPGYILSTAQDHRKGTNSAQITAWQLTFDTDAMVFTTHPGGLDVQPPSDWIGRTDGQPGYWTGTASLPRSAQHENVAIHIYEPGYPADAVDGAFPYMPRTHAYFPQDHFDEVVQQDGWTFGRVGDAYVALYSWRPTYWEDYDPAELALLPPSEHGPITRSFDLVAPGGADNVWIVEASNATESGSFVAFQGGVLGGRLEVTDLGGFGFDVRYRSPSQGLVQFGWEGPFIVEGVEQPLEGYPRVDNPWVTAERDDPDWEIQGSAAGITLDWTSAGRTVFAPEPGAGLLGAVALAGLALRSAATSGRSRRTSRRPPDRRPDCAP